MEPLKYLETYDSENTVKAYKQALNVFLSNIYGEGEITKLATRYLRETRNYETDLQDFLAEINGRPPTTVRLYISAVRTFLIENKVDLPQIFWRRLSRRVKGSMARTIDKVPSNIELRRIVSHMPVHGKALYLALASGGMRIGETLQLDLSDIDLDNDPVKISIRGEYTKSGNPRVAFISGETKEHIEEWLKYRTEYLKSASKRSRFGKSTEDTKLFPFSLSTAHFIWNNALDKSGFNQRDSSTKRHQIHPHVLRKFFRTKMGSAIPVDVAEALMGHKGYLTKVYRRYSIEDLAKFYKQGEPSVMIFGRKEEIASLRKEVEDRNKQLQTLVNGLTADNITLKQKVASLESWIQEQLQADREALRDLQKWREEFMRRQRKEVKK